MSELDGAGAEIRPSVSVGIVVVNFGSGHLLEENLARIDLSRLLAKVVVVDNFTSAAEQVAVGELARRFGWEQLLLEENLGFGAAMNVGVSRASALGCEVFLLLNPDALSSPDVIEELVAESVLNPLTIVSPKILLPDGSTWFQGGELNLVDGSTSTAPVSPFDTAQPWLTAACLVVHHEMWTLLGGFDDDYFLYWEDVDLSYRCTQVGGQLLVRQDLLAVHSVGGTQGGHGKSPTYYYYSCRNRLLFAAKHLPARRIFTWLLHSPRYSTSVVLRGGRRQLLRPWAPVSAGVRGTTRGMLIAGQAMLRALRSPAEGQPVELDIPGFPTPSRAVKEE